MDQRPQPVRTLSVDTLAVQVYASRQEMGAAAAFDVADVQALPNRYRYADYDVVYTGLGALVWLDDLDGWACGIGDALTAGGRSRRVGIRVSSGWWWWDRPA